MQKEDEQILIGLKKARTHLAKVILMVEGGEYCVSIMQQNLAVIGLLRSAHEALMSNHLQTCFKSAMETKNSKKKEQMIDEILKVTGKQNGWALKLRRRKALADRVHA